MTKVLITGANRGLGYELTRRYVAAGNTVFAACRTPAGADALNTLAADAANLHVVAMDVSDEQSVAAAAEVISAETNSLDTVINNAGILIKDQPIEQYNISDLDSTFAVNVNGPMLVAKYFVPLLRKGENAVLFSLSSQLGSLELLGQRRFGDLAYNASKAALNMLMRMLSHDLRDAGIAVVVAHPGWVQTDMGGSSADLTPDESADGLFKLINGLTMADTNRFYQWNGETHAW